MTQMLLLLPELFNVQCNPAPDRRLLVGMSRHLLDTIPEDMRDFDPATHRPWLLTVSAYTSALPGHKAVVTLPLPRGTGWLRWGSRSWRQHKLTFVPRDDVALLIVNPCLRELALHTVDRLIAEYPMAVQMQHRRLAWKVNRFRNAGMLTESGESSPERRLEEVTAEIQSLMVDRQSILRELEQASTAEEGKTA